MDDNVIEYINELKAELHKLRKADNSPDYYTAFEELYALLEYVLDEDIPAPVFISISKHLKTKSHLLK